MLSKRVQRIRWSHGSEEIEVKGTTGQINRFIVKAGGSAARGVSAPSAIHLDELREMKDLESYASLRYTLMAAKNPMIMSYTNAGDSHSVVLNAFRERGLAAAAGADDDIGYFEWSAPTDDIQLESNWLAANPAIGHTINIDNIQAVLNDPPEVVQTEVLCRWVQTISSIIGANEWNNCHDESVDLDPEKLMGTTQQKRECIQLNYDQFIFVDADIVFPEQLLKYQLNASYFLEGKYVLIPNIIKLGDPSWDVIVHDDFINDPFNQQHSHPPEETINQTINDVHLQQTNVFKFGCGMHTLYSKEFWDLMGIPESFGGYGPEDTFGMYSATLAFKQGYDIKQYVLKGIYTTEDYIDRVPSFHSKIKIFDMKQEFRDKATEAFPIELKKFQDKIKNVKKIFNRKIW